MEMPVPLLPCSKCHRDLPPEAFSINNGAKYRLCRHAFCKECGRLKYENEGGLAYHQQWRASHLEKCREANREYFKTVGGKRARSNGVLRHQKKYVERSHARQKAWRHRDELLKDACEICGSTKDLMLHHPDYSQPLLVQTLCQSCHQKIPAVIPHPKGRRPFKIVPYRPSNILLIQSSVPSNSSLAG
jgi:hypothetical protein